MESIEKIWQEYHHKLHSFIQSRVGDASHADTLPKNYQQALLLSEIESLPQKEVARKLGLSLPGAKARIQRGRKLLKNVWGSDSKIEDFVFSATVEAVKPYQG
ncbi:MAG: sigma factor-like helix-turn-helix DNA-binding protein [Candidatus Aminicenantaceae bacterium]